MCRGGVRASLLASSWAMAAKGASHHSQKNFLRLDEIIREIDVMMMIMMSRASIVIIVELRVEII